MVAMKGEGQLSDTDRIEIEREVSLGQAVIRGTCIPLETILRKLSEGMAEGEPIESYRGRVTPQDVKATLAYGVDAIFREARARFMRAERRRERVAGRRPGESQEYGIASAILELRAAIESVGSAGATMALCES